MLRSVSLTALAVAALSLSSVHGNAQGFPETVKLSTLNGTDGFRIPGLEPDDNAGKSVSRAGDFNGDGIDDFLIGATGNSWSSPNAFGKAYVVFGTASSRPSTFDLAQLDGTNGFRIADGQAGSYAGRSVSGAGDINGDGFDDILVGAPLDGQPVGNGAAYVIFGRSTSPGPELQLSALDGTNGFKLTTTVAGYIGHAVAGVGDVNHDGIDDFAVSAPNYSYGGGGHYAFIVFGKASAFDAVEVLGDSIPDGEGAVVFCPDDLSPYGCSSISAAGDFNGDGIDDLVFGPRGVQSYSITTVYFGRETGFPTSITLNVQPTSDAFMFIGGSRFGNAAGAGDVNGDGFDDIIVGKSYDESIHGPIDTAYVVFGRNLPDPNVPFLRTDQIDGSNGFLLFGAYDGFTVTDSAPAGLGDINGDGIDDVAFGYLDVESGREGSAVVFGRNTGFEPIVRLSSLDGSAGFKFGTEGIESNQGLQISGAGDLNSDGFSDVLIGLPKATADGKLNAGEAFVYFGKRPQSGVTLRGTRRGDRLVGGEFADNLFGLEGNDILEGAGAGDGLDGGAGSDFASYRHAPVGVIADLGNPSGNTGDAKGDSYIGIENLKGSPHNDDLSGNAERNRLVGGLGADKLTGQGGRDTFVFGSTSESPIGAGRDIVTDFNPGSALDPVDIINLEEIDANQKVPGNQAFNFIGQAAFSYRSGQLRVRLAGADVMVEGDVDGDAVADLQILLKNLSGISRIKANDFKL